MSDPTDPSDPTQIRNQPALTHGTGNTWLVVGGLMTAIAGTFFAFAIAQELQPPGVAIAGLLGIVAVYAGMLIVRFSAAPDRVRLRSEAVLLITLAAISLVCLVVIAAAEWSG